MQMIYFLLFIGGIALGLSLIMHLHVLCIYDSLICDSEKLYGNCWGERKADIFYFSFFRIK